MTSTMRAPATKVITRHPIRGAIWGTLLGLGVAIYLVLFAVIPFGDWILLALVVVGGIAVGVVWAYVAPPRTPKQDANDGGDEADVVGATDDTALGPTDPTDPLHLDADDGGAGDGGDGGADDGGADDGDGGD